MQKTSEEIDQMSPAELKAYKEDQRRVVFGHDVKLKNGKPVEQGFGATGRETSNHWAAMRKREQQGLEEKGTTDRLMAEAKARRKKVDA